MYGDAGARRNYEEQRKEQERKRLREEEQLDEEQVEQFLSQMDFEKFRRDFNTLDRFKQERIKVE